MKIGARLAGVRRTPNPVRNSITAAHRRRARAQNRADPQPSEHRLPVGEQPPDCGRGGAHRPDGGHAGTVSTFSSDTARIRHANHPGATRQVLGVLDAAAIVSGEGCRDAPGAGHEGVQPGTRDAEPRASAVRPCARAGRLDVPRPQNTAGASVFGPLASGMRALAELTPEVAPVLEPVSSTDTDGKYHGHRTSAYPARGRCDPRLSSSALAARNDRFHAGSSSSRARGRVWTSISPEIPLLFPARRCWEDTRCLGEGAHAARFRAHREA